MGLVNLFGLDAVFCCDGGLVDVSDIFSFFSALGEGEGGVRGERRGEVGFLLKIPKGGGVRRRGRGREGVCGELANFGGGGG